MGISYIGTNFDEVRRVLLDPSQEGVNARVGVKSACLVAKTVSAAAFCTSSIVTISSLVCVVSNPIFGAMGLVWGGVGCIGSREVFVIAENVEKILNPLSIEGKGLFEVLGNVRDATGRVLSASSFVDAIFKNTLFAGSFFGPLLIEVLDAPKR